MLQEIQEHTYSISIGAAQLSLLALYWRVFNSSRAARAAIWILTSLTVAWLVARVTTRLLAEPLLL